jgi:hypothetical protein
MRLTVTDKISHPGKTVNEDWFDHNDQAAWIFDGASGIVKDTIPGAASDPAWLSQTTSDEIKRVWDNNTPTRDILLPASQNTIRRYDDLMGDTAPPLIERPTACFAMARLWNDRLEVSTLYDSGIIYQSRTNVVTFGCVGSPLAKEVHKERDRLIADGTMPSQLHDLLLPMERQFRSMANVDGGYDIVDLTSRWAERLAFQTISIKSGDRLLLTTDGLYRLIDVFGKYDAASLIEAASRHGLESLYDELRALEISDSACSEFPRAKISDDVCAALLTIA